MLTYGCGLFKFKFRVNEKFNEMVFWKFFVSIKGNLFSRVIRRSFGSKK